MPIIRANDSVSRTLRLCLVCTYNFDDQPAHGQLNLWIQKTPLHLSGTGVEMHVM